MSRVLLGVHDREVALALQPQSEALHTVFDDRGAADENRMGELFFDEDLRRA